ncbi:MerR family transcriptional regulator [Sphingomonas sp. Leaf357]|uniref:MerR family transcriptional regulator n=1 Tax=Sphingomonas sp. Leaf357 TaxID=1736350 RepID=UPI0006F54F37|nr:helix-turn-helix domain-containing protein [Sphingomonas sp. Leaf357]KQS01812.1 MerR family transcriptional regulator [Sphingomonas sp. Leaf357]
MLMIGDLAKLTGTKVNTVRFYEAGGLLPLAERTASGRRIYGQADVQRLRFIRRTRHLGFSLDEVRTLLDLAGQHDRDCGTVDEIANLHLEEIDRKIADLTALRRELSGVIASCTGGKMAECRILEAFSPTANCEPT